MRSSSYPAWMRYGASVLAVGLALGIKLLLIPIVSHDEPFLLFFAAVLIAAWIGGLGPGLLATGLATLFNFYFFMTPYNQFALSNAEQPVQLALSVVEGACISVICTKLQSARQRAEDSASEARELERRILEISDAEQRRIGHDLHDGLGQHLTGIALMSKRLEQRLSASASPQAEEAIQITALARAAVEWTHDLCRSLSPTVLETRGLQDALHELTTNAETIFGIDCSFEQNGDPALPGTDLAAAMHLYRIAQEAISNAVKHGKAKHVSVSLARTGEDIDMMITDDGVGVAQSQNGLEDGMGLRIMRYRARMIGARIDVRRGNGETSGNGTGTVVTCRYRPGNPPRGNEA